MSKRRTLKPAVRDLIARRIVSKRAALKRERIRRFCEAVRGERACNIYAKTSPYRLQSDLWLGRRSTRNSLPCCASGNTLRGKVGKLPVRRQLPVLHLLRPPLYCASSALTASGSLERILQCRAAQQLLHSDRCCCGEEPPNKI